MQSRLIHGEFTILNHVFDVALADERSKQYRQLTERLFSIVSYLPHLLEVQVAERKMHWAFYESEEVYGSGRCTYRCTKFNASTWAKTCSVYLYNLQYVNVYMSISVTFMLVLIANQHCSTIWSLFRLQRQRNPITKVSYHNTHKQSFIILVYF